MLNLPEIVMDKEMPKAQCNKIYKALKSDSKVESIEGSTVVIMSKGTSELTIHIREGEFNRVKLITRKAA